jgi:hypothetical protein
MEWSLLEIGVAALFVVLTLFVVRARRNTASKEYLFAAELPTGDFLSPSQVRALNRVHRAEFCALVLAAAGALVAAFL